jgi:hypothetical protein
MWILAEMAVDFGWLCVRSQFFSNRHFVPKSVRSTFGWVTLIEDILTTEKHSLALRMIELIDFLKIG